MAITAGGRWVPSPGISYWPPAFPGAQPTPMATNTPAPATLRTTPPSASQAPLRVVTGTHWVVSTLDGSRVLNVGGRKFKIPRDSQVKSSRRAGVVWVRTGGTTYILSELGMLDQTPEERAATRWDLL
jgi:hypothetical protein